MELDIHLTEFKKKLNEELTKVINTPVSQLKKQEKARKQIEKIIKKTTKKP